MMISLRLPPPPAAAASPSAPSVSSFSAIVAPQRNGPDAARQARTQYNAAGACAPFDKDDARAAMVNGIFNSLIEWEKFADTHGQYFLTSPSVGSPQESQPHEKERLFK